MREEGEQPHSITPPGDYTVFLPLFTGLGSVNKKLATFSLVVYLVRSGINALAVKIQYTEHGVT